VFNSIFLSIVIPTYNEEKRIGLTLQKIQEYLEKQDYNYEIIVVDDGSKDNTWELLKETAQQNEEIYIMRNGENKGKGYSVKKGVLQSHGEYILFSDADLSTPIEEAEKLLSSLLARECDIAIGSRGLSDSDIQIPQPWYRRTMGRIFNLLVQIIVMRGIKDTQCGFKCFRRRVVYEIFPKQRINGFSFDVEILYIARKYHYRIKEIPVRWFNSPFSHVHPIRSSLEMFLDLIKIKINDWREKY